VFFSSFVFFVRVLSKNLLSVIIYQSSNRRRSQYFFVIKEGESHNAKKFRYYRAAFD